MLKTFDKRCIALTYMYVAKYLLYRYTYRVDCDSKQKDETVSMPGNKVIKNKKIALEAPFLSDTRLKINRVFKFTLINSKL